MATAVPYKLYKGSTNGLVHVQSLPGYNTPYSYQEIDYQGLGSAGKELLDYYKGQMDMYKQRGSQQDYDRTLNQYNSLGGDTLYTKLSAGNYDASELSKLFGLKEDIVKGFAPGGALPDSGYRIDPKTGNLTTQESLNQSGFWEGELAAGRAKNIGTASAPLYIPVGSPADVQVSGGDPMKATYSDPKWTALVEANRPKVNNASPSSGDLPLGTVTAPTPGTPSAPAVTSAYTASATQSLDAATTALKTAYDSQIKQLEAKMAESQKKIDEFSAKQKDILDDNIAPLLAPFRSELEKAERERLYITKNFEENQKLTDELGTLLTEGNTLIKQQMETTGLSSIRNPRINQTISDISARAGVIQAVMNARSGQIAEAYRMIDRSIEATTADRNDQLNYYKTLYDFYGNQLDAEGNKLVTLTQTEEKYLSAKIGLLENDLNNAQATADYIKKLLISPDSAYAMTQAGITLNDPVNVVNAKMAAYTTRVQTEQKMQENLQVIRNSGIQAQFYNKDGEIWKPDGYAFTSREDFLEKTGMTIDQAVARGMVKDIQAPVDLKDYPQSYQEYLLAKNDGFNGSYNDYQTLDANRKAVRNVTNNITPTDQATIDAKTYDLMVKQAPAKVGELKNQGKSWQDIANYFSALGINPGEPAIDDALHRAFQSQKDYENWKKQQE